jgi:ABC-type sugar transport system substrate-binding protein
MRFSQGSISEGSRRAVRSLGWRRVVAVSSALAVTAGLVGAAGSAGAAVRLHGANRLTIDWIQLGANNPFWTAENEGAAAAAKRYGFSFKALSGNLSEATQSTELEQLANEHVSTILITALDPAAMGTAFSYAKARGVPVISLYSKDSMATMSSGFAEAVVGHDMAVFSADMLKRRYGTVKGTVAVLGLELGQTLETYRIGGFVQTLKSYPGVKVVSVEPTNSQASIAQSVMQDWLTKYPNLSLVYGGSDTVTVPAITIAQRSHRVCDVTTESWKSNPSCIIFTSVDGDPIGIQAIAQGTLAGTDLYAPYWAGYQFAMMGYDLASHKMKPHTIVLQALPVDKTNVACINKMQTAMANDVYTFNFNGTLAQIAHRYGCPTVTISGGPPVKDPLAF